MATTLDWYGCATFRLRTSELTIFLDAYIDRAANAAGPGLSADDVTEADWVLVGHSHCGLRPDVAILAAAGRGNIDGEPIQGSLAQFIGRQADRRRRLQNWVHAYNLHRHHTAIGDTPASRVNNLAGHYT